MKSAFTLTMKCNVGNGNELRGTTYFYLNLYSPEGDFKYQLYLDRQTGEIVKYLSADYQ